MTSDAKTKPPDAQSPAYSVPQQHPAGLLYTMLRHGRGLSHEEAARLIRECMVQSRKAA